jgi:predicted metal-dependent hydrolase
LATIVLRHGYIHIWPRRRQAEAPPEEATEGAVLPEELKQQLVMSSQRNFESTLNQSVEKLHKDLQVTTEHINNLVMRVATEIVSGELEKYRNEFQQLHQQAASDMNGISDEITKHKAELEAKLAQEAEAEKQKLAKQLDTKLGDAVASFLLETLQHNVDLGNQNQYLISMLEEHKADFKKEVTDESQPSK